MTKEIDEFFADAARSRNQSDALQEEHRLYAATFVTGTVLPAFEQLKANPERLGRDRRVDIQHVSRTRVPLTIGRAAPAADGRGNTTAELRYTLDLAIDPTTAHGVKIVDDGDGPNSELLPLGSSSTLNQGLFVNDVLRHWQKAVRTHGATL